MNALGCLAIGFLGAAFAGPVLIRQEHRIAILVSLPGSFTTFSTFGQEVFALAADRELLWAGLSLISAVQRARPLPFQHRLTW